MIAPRVVTVDFETAPIQPRPKYPPEPCGVSIKWGSAWRSSPDSGWKDETRSKYYAWSHPTGNNCNRSEAVRALGQVWNSELPILFHNAPFDLSVAYERFGLPILPWQRVHDTMLLLFLFNPHARELSLKPSAEELLGWAPDEQDAVANWVWENRKALIAQYGGRDGHPENITRNKGKVSKAGAWISKVPAHIVGPYAEGDTDRTAALFEGLWPRIRAAGMQAAYDRERRLMPIFMANERAGLRVDQDALFADMPKYVKALRQVEIQMRHYLNAPDLEFDNDGQIAEAFLTAGAIKDGAWVTTKTGKLSVAKTNLPPESFTNPLFASAFGYRNRLVTCLRMFMDPWIGQARDNSGYVHTQWNQVRNDRGGTRTGRPSMSKPNMLNVSKSWNDRSDGYVHPDKLHLPELPLVRKYILPDPGHMFVHRDFDGQELRVFAHFESGELLEQYLQNPELDPHGWVKDRITTMTGRELDRTSTKVLNFQSMYGGGITAITEALHCSRKEAQEFKNFHDSALPGRKILSEEILRRVRRDEPIRTWGGRLYYCEPSSIVDGRRQTWEYKLINYLIQGSAADITKEAICRWHEGGGDSNGTRFLLTVYDEINLSVPATRVDESMEYLKEIMDGIELDCPMRSSGKVGVSWGELSKV